MNRTKELTYVYDEPATKQESIAILDFHIKSLKQQLFIESQELGLIKGERDCLRRRVEGYEKLTALLSAKIDELTAQLEKFLTLQEAA